MQCTPVEHTSQLSPIRAAPVSHDAHVSPEYPVSHVHSHCTALRDVVVTDDARSLQCCAVVHCVHAG